MQQERKKKIGTNFIQNRNINEVQVERAAMKICILPATNWWKENIFRLPADMTTSEYKVVHYICSYICKNCFPWRKPEQGRGDDKNNLHPRALKFQFCRYIAFEYYCLYKFRYYRAISDGVRFNFVATLALYKLIYYLLLDESLKRYKFPSCKKHITLYMLSVPFSELER